MEIGMLFFTVNGQEIDNNNNHRRTLSFSSNGAEGMAGKERRTEQDVKKTIRLFFFHALVLTGTFREIVKKPFRIIPFISEEIFSKMNYTFPYCIIK
jgi:hypothetical protein